MNLVKDNTPFEEHEGIIVKREDLSCPEPGPSFSKIRGIQEVLNNIKKGLVSFETVGVVDTLHSKAGWGVAYLAKEMGLKCIVFYPHFKREKPKHVRPYQKKCRDLFGAEIYPLPATKSSVLFYQARKILYKNYLSPFMMPNGLKLKESVFNTCKELVNYTPKDYLNPNYNWVISASSGTIAAGVLLGLSKLDFRGKVYIHLGFSRLVKTLLNYFNTYISGFSFKIEIIDEKYEYKDFVKYPSPFPCNPFYDLKAWKWIRENKKGIGDKILFWNIGK